MRATWYFVSVVSVLTYAENVASTVHLNFEHVDTSLSSSEVLLDPPSHEKLKPIAPQASPPRAPSSSAQIYTTHYPRSPEHVQVPHLQYIPAQNPWQQQLKAPPSPTLQPAQQPALQPLLQPQPLPPTAVPAIFQNPAQQPPLVVRPPPPAGIFQAPPPQAYLPAPLPLTPLAPIPTITQTLSAHSVLVEYKEEDLHRGKESLTQPYSFTKICPH